MKNKKYHIIIILFLVWSFSFAQQYTNYSTKQGLPSNHVYTILQDAKGFMWFLTDKGMVKYNGKTFKTFTTKDGLPNNDVWEAFTTPDGRIWYITKSPKLGYIENDSIISFTNQNKNEIINPIYSAQIKNKVYPISNNKAFTLKDNVWQQINTDNNDSTLFKVFNNKVGFINFNEDLKKIRFYNNKKQKFKSIQIDKHFFSTSRSSGQLNDSLFFYANKNKYAILNLNTQSIKEFLFKDQIKLSTVKYPRLNVVNNQIQITGIGFVGILNSNFHITKPFYFPPKLNAHFGFIDRQSNIWFSTFNKGVYKLPFSKQNITYNFEDKKIQKFNYIDNQLFVSVFNKGFYKFKSETKEFESYIAENNFIYGVSKAGLLNKTFFLTKDKVIVELQNKERIINSRKAINKDDYVYSGLKKIVNYNSETYGIYTFGIYKFNHNNFKIKKDINIKGCNDILVFNNRFIIATNFGLKELKNNKIHSLNFKNEVFNKSILSIKKISKTQILINTDGFGSFISDLNTIKPLTASSFLIVQDAYVKNNTIWLATNQGVLHFIKINNTYKLIKKYSINNGLPSDNVNTIFVNKTHLFVGTNNGLAQVPITQKTHHSFIDLFIENAIYNNTKITNTNNIVNYKNNSNLSIETSAIDFSEKQNTTFTYKLEPIQKKWITTTTNTINFNNLEPNNYAFYLKSNGIKKQLSFTIKPLWWQTIWAKSIALFLILTLIALISWKLSKNRQNKKTIEVLQEKQISEIQLKALRSQMNPHFVFNSLAAIQYYINNNEIEASETYLIKFSKLIRQFFELSKETEISLKQEIALIKNYLDIEKLRFKDKFQYKIYCNSSIDVNNTKLPTMLLQPIVENAVNHGVFNKMDNGNIIINFYCEALQSLKVEIIDDGVGFINTKSKSKQKVKSSNVLEDRLRFLNQSGLWQISYVKEELNPKLKDKGNKTTFIITQL